MGKRLISFLVIFTVIFTLSSLAEAQPVSAMRAENVARNFLEKIRYAQPPTLKKGAERKVAMISTLTDPEGGTQLGYIVHLQPKGFLVLSAWAEKDPIISYSLTQDWYSGSSGESVFTQLLYSDLRSQQQRIADGLYEDNEKNISALSGDEVFYQWPAAGTTATSGWVETKWIQGFPYNQFCPVDSLADTTKHSAVGCIATAITQVINYHQYIGDIGELTFNYSDTYTTSDGKFHIDTDSSKYDFPGFGQLNKYLQSIKSKYLNKIALDSIEKAALCFAVGIAVKMDYTVGASTIGGLYKDTALPLKNKFNYHSADFSLATKNKFEHDLIDNLMNGLPAVIYLFNHAIIADGYNTAGYFHLNFGWSGDNPEHITQTWYKPDGSSLPEPYTKFDSGIINIKPVADALDLRLTAGSDQVKLPCTKIGEVSPDQTFVLTNSGSVTLHLDDILISENFTVNPLNGFFNSAEKPILIQPQGKLELIINCIPDKVGKLTDRMQILVSHNGARRHLNVDLCGFGVLDNGTTITDAELNGLLTVQGSPYYICNNIRVPADHRLEIEAGTSLIFTGPYQITIGQNSRFIAIGTENDSVYFMALDSSIGWQGIYFNDSGADDSLAYCVIKHIRNIDFSWGKTTISAIASSPQITHCRITDNRSSFRGGAVYLYDSHATKISNCIIENNTCSSTDGAGGVHLINSSLTASNVIFSQNRSKKGGAIYCDHSSLSLINTTITDNSAALEGGAIYLSNAKKLQIKNSVLWSNKSGYSAYKSGLNKITRDTLMIHYSDIDTVSWDWLGGYSIEAIRKVLVNSQGNIYQDPLFNEPQQNDYTLQFDSPCIDSGDPYDDYSMEPQSNGGRINMGVYGGTIKAAITGIATHMDDTALNTYRLEQNYPNPFNPRTTINYELPARSAGGQFTNYVELSIYNLLGQKVATLVNEKQQAGSYKVEWNAYKFAAGVYYYRLKAGTYQQVRKMVLLK